MKEFETAPFMTEGIGVPGQIVSYQGHGVFVPEGMNVAEIMTGARVLEERFEVAPFTSRHMVIAVLESISAIGKGD